MDHHTPVYVHKTSGTLYPHTTDTYCSYNKWECNTDLYTSTVTDFISFSDSVSTHWITQRCCRLICQTPAEVVGSPSECTLQLRPTAGAPALWRYLGTYSRHHTSLRWIGTATRCYKRIQYIYTHVSKWKSYCSHNNI